MNIFGNFIPHDIGASGDKDPPWLSKQIKIILKGKKLFRDTTQRTLYPGLSEKIQDLQIKLQNLIEASKVEHYKKKFKKIM